MKVLYGIGRTTRYHFQNIREGYAFLVLSFLHNRRIR